MIRINFEKLEGSLPALQEGDLGFTTLVPDIGKTFEVAGTIGDVKNIIVVGRGGSVSSYRAFWRGMGRYISEKNSFIVDTSDPDYISYVKEKCATDKSIVIVISKSGNTVDVLENMMVFDQYKQVVITTIEENALYNIAKNRGIELLAHLPVGGRFSGLTEVGLLPSMLAELDISEIRKGATDAYSLYSQHGNDAQRLAGIVRAQSDKGANEIYMPIYSKRLVAFSELITQLIHESVGKGGKGVSVLAVEGPEAQHHTNQRFFGGPKNMFGIFTTLGTFNQDERVNVPQDISQLDLKNKLLKILDGLPLSETMKFESQGTMEDAKKKGLPFVHLELDKLDEYHLGYYTAFLQVFTVYLARAFGVNPFDQPEVESSKEISFTLRENYKK